MSNTANDINGGEIIDELMSELPSCNDKGGSAGEYIDKNGAEYNIIMELTNWRTLATMSFNAFHGQEIGEDPEFDKLDKRERKAYKTLLSKIEAYAAKQTRRELLALSEQANIYYQEQTEAADDIEAVPLAVIDKRLTELEEES